MRAFAAGAFVIAIGLAVSGCTSAEPVLGRADCTSDPTLGKDNAQRLCADQTPEPPPFWTPIPQPDSKRTGVYTACHLGYRLWMTEGGGTPGSTSITSQLDPYCAGK